MTLVTRTYDDEQWAVVPKEPTKKMINAFHWAGMLAAAPQPPVAAPVDAQAVHIPAPGIVDHSHPNQAYVTYGFRDEAECRAFMNVTKRDQTLYRAPPEAQAAPVGAKPVAVVRVRHGGYGMELSEYVAYALPEGLHDLYTTPEAQAAPVAAMTDEIRAFLENLAKAGSEPLNSVVVYRDTESRRHFMGEIRNTARALLARAAVETAPVVAMTDAEIREIFIAAGFTVKDGQTDLKPYVYAAARSLLARGAVQGSDNASDDPSWKIDEIKEEVRDVRDTGFTMGFDESLFFRFADRVRKIIAARTGSKQP